MDHLTNLRRLGLFDARVPRYTSYPPATAFDAQIGEDFQRECLQQLDPAQPVSVYIHIPFCERLCWFCACRTQGTSTLKPVAHYMDVLKQELAMLRTTLPDGVRMGQMHWGGGTPTILPPEMIKDLATALKETIPPAEDFSFSVEIDPTLVDQGKIDMLAAMGMTRASIGIQDFDPEVQNAIGREQSFAATLSCVESLRTAGIHSLNTDLVYGLPHQTAERFDATLDQVHQLDPDRVALFGYAHVPTFSKRQKLIPNDALPDEEARYALAQQAAKRFTEAGYQAIGIDHFGKPSDSLTKAANAGHLRRNFQGYTDDTCPTLIGIGASSISQFAQGYVQNAAATAAYGERIEAGKLAGHRGYALTQSDLLRADAINMLMCDFEIDLAKLNAHPDAEDLVEVHASVVRDFKGYVVQKWDKIRITDAGRPLTRIIAQRYDSFSDIVAQYSQAS
ncbi:oxygen-independent coproporphyrinogen III oxidase [Cognatiyoonia sp. IB215182]|uniref:oxygen-independent coproporphyrinogen III oxidase n=1 Tax=Cognatiyoonia sp. IB215182 TaxID=3097353 RepID=UPI002A17D3AD|nr:oxygen-independent coproporphyrinogen III oxidase [Cognatiyoonia sp. IB215182]MDX8353525.1 oxygen-independent coproporphyrinogen III oxidase [Cognatiyoonia sp. IB215182]